METLTLDEQRELYKKKRFLAMPLAGTIAWIVVAIGGMTLAPIGQVWTLYIATGSIVYLGMFISKFTGEHFLDKTKPKTSFDYLFYYTMFMALLVFAIAIPFANVDHTSLPLTVGILTGLMWVPLSWAIQHWVGLFHGIGRSILVVGFWYLFPEDRFVVIPLIIVAMYLISIYILEKRFKTVNS